MIKFNGLPDVFSEEMLKKWLTELSKSHDYSLKNLVYNFVSNDEILEINKKHLEHNYYTDIISFDYVRGTRVSGEIFISIDQVEIQRHDFGNNFEQEMLRVIAHGLLHFIGFNDKTEEESEEMRAEEEKSLVLHAQISGN